MIPQNFEEILYMPDPASYKWERTSAVQSFYDSKRTDDHESYILSIWEQAKPYENQSFDGVINYTLFVSENAWLVSNPYTYSLPNDCQHYVLWLKHDTPELQVNNILASYFEGSLNPREFRAWRNKKNQSVPNLNHYQVICSTLS